MGMHVVVWNDDTNETLYYEIVSLPYLIHALPKLLKAANWGKGGVINYRIYFLPPRFFDGKKLKQGMILDNRELCLLHEGFFRGVAISKNTESKSM